MSSVDASLLTPHAIPLVVVGAIPPECPEWHVAGVVNVPGGGGPTGFFATDVPPRCASFVPPMEGLHRSRGVENFVPKIVLEWGVSFGVT